jgi:hypothetical protein
VLIAVLSAAQSKMVKKISILSLFVFMLVITGCEKCAKPDMNDPFVNATYDQDDSKTRGGTDGGTSINGSTDGDITDPNEGEDFDGIVDPDEDEDFDADGK